MVHEDGRHDVVTDKKDCASWKKDRRVKMRTPKDKEVDIGTDSTENDQHSPGKSYLFQFFTLNNIITHWKSRRHCRLGGI